MSNQTASKSDRHFGEVAGGRRVTPTNPFIEFTKEEVEQSIPERFEQMVREYPDRIAVKTKTLTLSYDALNKAANRVAWAISTQRGDGTEPIALLLEHGAPMIAAILGVLKAGKIYVPLDPTHSQSRLGHTLEDSEATLIVTNNKNLPLTAALASKKCSSLNIDELNDAPVENLSLSISPDRLAYIRYTSGSTGEPKGVMERHRNLLHVVLREVSAFHFCADDRLTFIGSWGKHIFRGLLTGASLFPVNVKEQGPGGLDKWLAEEKITVLHSTSTLFRHIIDSFTGEETLPALRLVRLAGEPVSKRDVELYKKHFSSECILVNELASTEAGGITTYFIDKRTEITSHIVPVGYPLDDVEVLLLNDEGRELELNKMGEIAVKSRYLFPGYWRKPELTRAVFLTDPKGGEEKRIFRTGDLGVIGPDGCLVHLGRKDLRIKIRGFRVEPGEIETVLGEHLAVRQAVVTAREDAPGEKRLVAYVVADQESIPTVSELRSFLKEKLPDYMIPSTFVMLESLPLSPNGKVNRRALPVPDQARPELGEAFVAPRTSVEEVLASIWSKILTVEQVGIYDDFFELGGHSLLVGKLIAQIKGDLRVDLPVRVLFESPTIAQLAARIGATQDEDFHLQKEKGAYSYLVKLQPGQSQIPVFCFPYIGGFRGDLLRFAQLGRLIASDYCFYGLQARGTDGVSQPHRRVEDMASDYIEEIQTLQPHGPYFLVGECFSSAVAYETAQQLRARGEEVALLAFLDAKCSRQSLGGYLWRRLSARLRYRIQPILESWGRIGFHLREIQRLERGKRLRYFVDKTGKGLAVISLVLRGETPLHPQWANIDPGDADRRKSKHVQRAQKAYWLAVSRYRRRPYQGRITLLLNEEWYGSDPTLRWADVAAGGQEAHKIPGNHFTYITENIQIVAKELKECLDRASDSRKSVDKTNVAKLFVNQTERSRSDFYGWVEGLARKKIGTS